MAYKLYPLFILWWHYFILVDIHRCMDIYSINRKVLRSTNMERLPYRVGMIE